MGFWEAWGDKLAGWGLAGGGWGKGRNWLILALGALGITLLIAGSLPPSRSVAPQETAQSRLETAQPRQETVIPGPGVDAEMDAYQRAYEEQLTSLLSQIEGAGEVTVRVYLEAGAVLEYAEKVQKTTKTTQEQDKGGASRLTSETTEETEVVTVRDDASRQEKPVVVTRREPTIRGVVVAAEGASDPRVKLRLTEAVEAALDLPAHRIRVFTRKVR